MAKFVEIMEDIFNLDEIQSIEKLIDTKIVIYIKGRESENPIYTFGSREARDTAMYEIAGMLIDRF